MNDLLSSSTALLGTVLQYKLAKDANNTNKELQKQTNNTYLTGVRETNDANLALAEQQNKWNLLQWRRENAYNDPSAQANRLRLAGLSSAAAAQALSGGTASPLQSADLSVLGAPQPVTAPQVDTSGYNIIGMARAMEDLISAHLQNRKLNEETKSYPEKLRTENQINDWTLKGMISEFERQQKEFPYRFSMLHDEVLSARYSRKLKKFAIKQAQLQYDIDNENFGFMKQFHQHQLDEIFQDIANKYETWLNLKKEGKLLDQQFDSNQVKAAFDKYGGVPDSFAERMAILISEGIINPEDVKKNAENFGLFIKYLREGLRSYLPNSINKLIDSLYGDDEDDSGFDFSDLLSPISNGLPKVAKKRK